MDKQALIDRAVEAGMDADDARRLIGNAPYMAEAYGMKPIITLEQFAGLLMYRVLRKLEFINNDTPFSGDKGVAIYDAAGHLQEINLLSLAGIYPVAQRDLFPQKEA